MRVVKTDIPDKGISGYDKSFSVDHFFFKQNCFLKDRKFDNIKMAGNIIEHFCDVYEINQRYIMVSLQRETGAISCQDESKFGKLEGYGDGSLNKIDYILCCGVPDDPKDLSPIYKGFENQVAGCCATLRHRLNEYTDNSINLLLDKSEPSVKPATMATYAMLRYTPWLSVINLNDQLFKQYFGDYV